MNRYRFKFLGVVVLIGVSMSVLVRCSYRVPTDEPLDDGRYDSISIIPSINESQEHVVLNRSEASDDLAQLADIICTRHSYTSSTEFDYVAAIDHLKSQLPDEIPAPVLGLQIQKLIQYLGDNHARIDNWLDLLPQRYLPFSFGFKGSRVFAFHRNRSGLLDEQHPYVRSIDGISMKAWLERAGDITSGPGGSTSQRWQRSLDLLEYVDFMRSELGLPSRADAVVMLESADGSKAVKRVVVVADEREIIGKAFGLPQESRILSGNIGYLRIYSQRDDDLLASIDPLMAEFQSTDALIIDARQCGGGRRSNLQALFPYFISPEDEPYIANVAKLRIPDGAKDFDPKGKLDVGDKKLKYRDDDDVTDLELAALDNFLSTFSPGWSPPESQFTDWYFMAMTRQPNKYFYDRPVFLVMDWGVGSAGDIFVSTFKGWRDVTLVGSPSNGRSGNSQTFPLTNSGIPVRLSTMASFQKTGEKYDNVGIQPDVVIEAEISDWLEATDTVLERVRGMVNAAVSGIY